jgi:hypothetical protein
MVDGPLHERIEQYLLGRLSSEEAARMESEMASDPELADQVALQRLALMGMQRLAARDMRTRFEQWDKESDLLPESDMPNKSQPSLWFWTTIALFLLLLVATVWYFSQKTRAGNNQDQKGREVAVRDSLIDVLRADYREKSMALDSLIALTKADSDTLNKVEIKRLQEELELKDKALRELERRRNTGKPQIARQLAPPSPRFRGDQDDSVLGKAREAIDSGKYEEAVRLLRSISANDSRQAQVTQILPYALFYAGKYKEAIPAFITLWEQDSDNEAMNAQGYLLLCYVAEGNMQEARQMRLVILQNPKHKFFKTAKDLGETIR